METVLVIVLSLLLGLCVFVLWRTPPRQASKLRVLILLITGLITLITSLLTAK